MPTDTVQWKNDSWSPTAQIEIRKGKSFVPTENPIISSPVISKDQTFTLTSTEPADYFWKRITPSPQNDYSHRSTFGFGQKFNEKV